MRTPATKKSVSALFIGLSSIFAAAPAAQAVVITQNLVAAPLDITDSVDGLYLNVVTGLFGASDINVGGWDINPYDNGAGLTFYSDGSPAGILATGTPGTSAVAQSLTTGAIVGATSAGFYNPYQTVGTNFQASSGTRYVGFRFLNEATNATNYGYLQLTTVSGTGFPASITGYAFDNAGAAISVASIGVVPEVSTDVMMAVGLTGLFAITRRRRRS